MSNCSKYLFLMLVKNEKNCLAEWGEGQTCEPGAPKYKVLSSFC